MRYAVISFNKSLTAPLIGKFDSKKELKKDYPAFFECSPDPNKWMHVDGDTTKYLLNAYHVAEYGDNKTIKVIEKISGKIPEQAINVLKNFFLAEIVAIRLKKMREEKCVTQSQLAEITEMKQSAIARIESGKVNITLATLSSITDALGYSVEVIIK